MLLVMEDPTKLSETGSDLGGLWGNSGQHTTTNAEHDTYSRAIPPPYGPS